MCDKKDIALLMLDLYADEDRYNAAIKPQILPLWPVWYASNRILPATLTDMAYDALTYALQDLRKGDLTSKRARILIECADIPAELLTKRTERESELMQTIYRAKVVYIYKCLYGVNAITKGAPAAASNPTET